MATARNRARAIRQRLGGDGEIRAVAGVAHHPQPGILILGFGILGVLQLVQGLRGLIH